MLVWTCTSTLGEWRSEGNSSIKSVFSTTVYTQPPLFLNMSTFELFCLLRGWVYADLFLKARFS